MALKPQSIRKGINVYFDGKLVDKQTVLNFSANWTESQETVFKKALKQGGEISINGVKIRVTPQDKIVNSQGEKDPGIFVFPGLDARF
jgi:hypothetical protein